MTTRDYLLAFGSNLGDRRAHLSCGLAFLLDGGAQLVAASSLWETSPVGGPEQGDFLNACVILRDEASPQELLKRIADAERAAQRVRAERNGPRTLDVDILLAGEEVIDDDELQVPHPRMLERAFVMRPACEIASRWRHPGTGLLLEEHPQDWPSSDAARRVDAWSEAEKLGLFHPS